jgi:hypothetical protein
VRREAKRRITTTAEIVRVVDETTSATARGRAYRWRPPGGDVIESAFYVVLRPAAGEVDDGGGRAHLLGPFPTMSLAEYIQKSAMFLGCQLEFRGKNGG